MLAQVGNQGNVGNQNGNVVNENIQENDKNVLVNGNQVGCSYKEFLACNPKEYDGKGGVVVLTRWIKKIENVYDISGCIIDQKVKYTTSSFVEFCLSHEMQKLETELWNHTMIGAGHPAYTDRFHELARLVPHLVTPKSRRIERYAYGIAPQICEMVAAMKPKTMQKAIGNVGEPSKDKNGRDDNKRNRIGNVFGTTVSPIGRENMGTWPKSAYPRLNRAQGLKGNCPNQVDANNGEETRQDPNIMTATFTLNDHFATTLFDSGADYSFVSTTFIPMLGIKPSDLGFRYEIEIASGQLVEIDKVINGCKLEIEGFIILIKNGSVAKDKKQREIVVVRDFPEVRILQKSQENQTKTDTRMERVRKGQELSRKVNLGQLTIRQNLENPKNNP
nr:reverse transcriptase domain-containing protein [Tanacetum cinerariifolium]